MKLYLIICNFEKFRTVNEITFNSVRKQAQSFGFDVSISYISQERYTTREQMQIAKKDYPNVNFYLYNNEKTENECIFDALRKQRADRYFVCDARYLELEELVSRMLDSASYYGVHFVRCDNEYKGVFEGVVKFFTKINNRILKFVSSAQFSSYVRNLVIFDSTVFSYMERSPMNAAKIRETDYLINTLDCNVDFPVGYNLAKHYNNNWLGLTVSVTSLLLSLWCFICIFIASTNFNTTTWLISGFIGFGVLGFVLLLISLSSGRTAYYKPLRKHTVCEPLFVLESAKHSLSKSKEAQEQVIAGAVADDFEITNKKEQKQAKTTKTKKATKQKNEEKTAGNKKPAENKKTSKKSE